MGVTHGFIWQGEGCQRDGYTVRKECSQILYGREGGADPSARRRVYTRWKVVTMIYLVVGGGVRDAKGVHLMGGGGV